MLEKYCDILVLGDKLPGLITAAFLARRGLNVQVVTSDIFSSKRPEPLCLNKIQSTLLRSILGRLNVSDGSIHLLLEQDSTLQVIFPKNRIDVSNNPLNYFEEIEREFSEHSPVIKSFYENQSKSRHTVNVTDLFEKLIPASWKESRAFKKFIADNRLNDKNPDWHTLLASDSRIKCFFEAQTLIAYQQIITDPFAYQISALFNPGDGEIFGITNARNMLKEILTDRVTHYEGSVRPVPHVGSLLFRNSLFEGIDCGEATGQVFCKYLIWNDSLEKLSSLLPKKWRFRSLRKQCQAELAQFHWFTSVYSLDSLQLPEPMHSNVIVINDPDKELSGDNFLYLQISQDINRTKSRVAVNFLLTPSALTENDEFFEPYFDTITATLLQLMPFSEKSLKRVFPLTQQTSPQDTLFPLNENEFEIFRRSAADHKVTTQNKKNFVELFPLHYRTPAPNFYISHPSIFAGFGLDAQLLLGLKITDEIWQEVEKVKKHAMKSERRIA